MLFTSRREVSPRLPVGWATSRGTSAPRSSPPSTSGDPGRTSAVSHLVCRCVKLCLGLCLVSRVVVRAVARVVAPRVMSPCRVSSPPRVFPPVLTPSPPARTRTSSTASTSTSMVVEKLDGHDIYPNVAVPFLLMSFAVFYLVWELALSDVFAGPTLAPPSSTPLPSPVVQILRRLG